MQKSDTLIRTKLHLPFTRLELVSRPRLQEQIAQGLRGPLTLITAPAGFGKTTLVASCIISCGMPVAWLSLDKGDNQVERFLSYLVAALQEAHPTIGSEAAQLLAAARQAPPEAVLTGLINDLETASEETALVLDDYQFISNQAVHEGVAFLLEHCPKTFHLVIATRSDPPLPLTRLRARGQTVELRAVDLSFTEPEAAQFLNDVMGLSLDAGSVALLAERTEGWIVGLQMAAQWYEQNGLAFVSDAYDEELLRLGRRNLTGFRNSLESGAYAAGGILSTSEDVARFLHALFNGRVISYASLAEMKTFLDAPDEDMPEQTGYGLGLRHLTIDGEDLLGHTGSIPDYSGIAMHN